MIDKFLEELNALQDNYGIYIDADYEEDAYVVFVNKGGYEIQDIYKDENFHYHILR